MTKWLTSVFSEHWGPSSSWPSWRGPTPTAGRKKPLRCRTFHDQELPALHTWPCRRAKANDELVNERKCFLLGAGQSPCLFPSPCCLPHDIRLAPTWIGLPDRPGHGRGEKGVGRSSTFGRILASDRFHIGSFDFPQVIRRILRFHFTHFLQASVVFLINSYVGLLNPNFKIWQWRITII